MRFISNGITALTGYSADEIVGNREQSFASLIHPRDADQVEKDVLEAVEAGHGWNIEYRLLHRDGSFRWVHECGVAIIESGEVRYLDGFVVDISERRDMQEALRVSEQRIRELAYYDSVTRLPNRNLILEDMEDRIKKGRPFCLYYIDLNDFKPVNDKHGHLCGDTLLARIGTKIRFCVEDHHLVGRLGGDEFVVICDDTTLVEDIKEAIEQPIVIQRHEIQVSASIGVCRYPEDASTIVDVLRIADRAMYQSKKQNKCRVIQLRRSAQ